MAKPTLLVTRKLPDAVEARAARDYDARLNLDDARGANGEIIGRAREIGASGILCAPGDPFDSACINALPPSVKIIATFSVGFDHIDIAAAKARGIVVTNTPGVLSFAVAECALMLMLMAARRAGEGERMVRAGKWPPQFQGVTLENKKLGILGFGRIGRELAGIARQGFRMEIHYRNVNRADYEWVQHVAPSKAAGVTDEQRAALERHELAEAYFNPQERPRQRSPRISRGYTRLS